MTPTQTQIVQSEYQDVLQGLQALTNQHEKTYRLKVGELILQRFFGGSAALFSSNDPTKTAKFKDFLDVHAGDIAEMDLPEQTLRRCVRVKICHESLPPAARDQLKWSALLAISAISEVNLRARVAMAAVGENWPLGKVREVVAQAHSGRVWDTDPQTPGLQLPEPKPEPAPQPGRLVTRTEKWTEEVSAWHQEFERIDAGKLNKAQVARVRTAVATLRGQLDALEKKLGSQLAPSS